MKLESALNIIEENILDKNAAVAIIGDHADETNLVASRDGVLNFIKTLLSQVIELDKGQFDENSDNTIKSYIYDFSYSTYIVDVQILKNKTMFINKLKKVFEDDIESMKRIMYDPEFQ